MWHIYYGSRLQERAADSDNEVVRIFYICACILEILLILWIVFFPIINDWRKKREERIRKENARNLVSNPWSVVP